MKLEKRVRDEDISGCRIANNRICYRVSAERRRQFGSVIYIITFSFNEKYTTWRDNLYQSFRLFVSKKERDYVLIMEDGRKIIRWQEVIASWPSYMYVEISAEDEAKIKKLTGKESNNHQMETLFGLLEAFREERIMEGKKRRAEILDDEVYKCPEEIPEGLGEWIRREVLANDDHLIYKRGNIRGVCALCGCKVKAAGRRFIQGTRVECPACGHSVYCVLENGESWNADFVENIATVQKGDDGESVWIRIFHLMRNNDAVYPDPVKNLDEVARYCLKGFKVAMWVSERKEYHFASRCMPYKLKNWERNGRIYIYDGYSYKVFRKGIEDEVTGTRLEYFNLNEIFKEQRDPLKFMIDVIRFPCIEFLYKTGYKNIVECKVGNRLSSQTRDILRWERKKVDECFKFPMSLLKLKRPCEWTEYDILNLNKISKIEGLTREEIQLLLENPLCITVVKMLKRYRAPETIIKYIKKQSSPRDNLASVYEDYIKECFQLELDITDKNVIFPKNLTERHAETSAAVAVQQRKIDEARFKEISEGLKGMSFEYKGLILSPAPTAKSLIKEGSALRHCVGTYVERMLRKETAIFFIRKKEDPAKSFFTLEYRDGKLIQCRGKLNRSYTENADVKEFVEKWLIFIKRSKKKCKKSA